MGALTPTRDPETCHARDLLACEPQAWETLRGGMVLDPRCEPTSRAPPAVAVMWRCPLGEAERERIPLAASFCALEEAPLPSPEASGACHILVLKTDEF